MTAAAVPAAPASAWSSDCARGVAALARGRGGSVKHPLLLSVGTRAWLTPRAFPTRGRSARMGTDALAVDGRVARIAEHTNHTPPKSNTPAEDSRAGTLRRPPALRRCASAAAARPLCKPGKGCPKTLESASPGRGGRVEGALPRWGSPAVAGPPLFGPPHERSGSYGRGRRRSEPPCLTFMTVWTHATAAA